MLKKTRTLGIRSQRKVYQEGAVGRTQELNQYCSRSSPESLVLRWQASLQIMISVAAVSVKFHGPFRFSHVLVGLRAGLEVPWHSLINNTKPNQIP